jgi:hypothetical protein
LGKGAALGAEGDAGAIKPDVLGDDGASLVNAVEAVSVLVVKSGVRFFCGHLISGFWLKFSSKFN